MALSLFNVRAAVVVVFVGRVKNRLLLFNSAQIVKRLTASTLTRRILAGRFVLPFLRSEEFLSFQEGSYFVNDLNNSQTPHQRAVNTKAFESYI